jgi:hypothetical protein
MIGRFRLFPFVLGLIAGGIALSFYKPEKQVILQYPHPSDTDTKIFRDPNKICYKYTSHEVDCDANERTLKDYPVQGAK